MNNAVVPSENTKPPPPYYPISGAQPSPIPRGPIVSSPPPPHPPPHALPPPSNFVFVQRRNETLKCTYVIDPTLNIPEGMLPMLKRRQERKNLHLDTRKGNVKADIHLVGPGVPVQRQYSDRGVWQQSPTSVSITTRKGLISAEIVRLPGHRMFQHTTHCYAKTSGSNHPFNLYSSARKGSISLALPREFRGLLLINTRKGWINFSSAFDANLSTSSEVKGKRVYYVRNGSTNDRPGMWTPWFSRFLNV